MSAFDQITLGQIVEGVGPLVTLLGGVAALARPLRRWARIADAIQGTSGIPGVPGQPGILARLENAESQQAQTLQEIRGVRLDIGVLSTQVGGMAEQIETAIVPAVAELQTNHGSSLHDKINQIAVDTARASTRAVMRGEAS